MKKTIIIFAGICITIMSGISGYCKTFAGKDVSLSVPVPAPVTNEPVDYALSKYWQAWTHHPVFGDASFDNFKRLPGNPVCRGDDEFEWPVNGFLFKDPVSGDWILYVAWYNENYSLKKEDERTHCRAYRSNDKGKSWQDFGNLLDGFGTYVFQGETSPIGASGGSTVFYKDGFYHLSFGWATMATTWQNIRAKDPAANSGAGYGVSDSPVGPFKPVCAYFNNRDMKVLHGKYNRFYAPMLLPRGKDWIAFLLADSHLYYGWGLAGQTAPRSEGPWSELKLLLHPQQHRYFPQLLEFYPQFIHEGFVYAPATSVAGNRNYQAVFRAPIEKAMDSDAWELFQDGSAWHSEPVEWEYEGIWGQTYSGFVDDDGMFYVMFPSRDSENRGTIGLACRPWDKPFRQRGFVTSGHLKPSITVLKHDTKLKQITAELTIHGTVMILWNHDGPFGTDVPRSDCGLHPLMRRQFDALELSNQKWKLIRYDADGNRTDIADGQATGADGRYSVELEMNNGNLELEINGQDCWEGPFESVKGRAGVWVEKRSHAEVTAFKVQGDTSETSMDFLYTEALQCAAQNVEDWEMVKSDSFRYGEGAVSKAGGDEVKWNFIGDGFSVWAPTGPGFGKGEIWLDGKHLADINFHSPQGEASRVLYENRHVPYGRHGVKLKVVEGRVPVDILEAYTR